MDNVSVSLTAEEVNELLWDCSMNTDLYDKLAEAYKTLTGTEWRP